jgi:hypothetical protein
MKKRMKNERKEIKGMKIRWSLAPDRRINRRNEHQTPGRGLEDRECVRVSLYKRVSIHSL